MSSCNKKQNYTTVSIVEVDVFFVTIETKAIGIEYIYTNKVIVVSLTNLIPSDGFKTHTLCLGIRKVHSLGVFYYVMDTLLLK